MLTLVSAALGTLFSIAFLFRKVCLNFNQPNLVYCHNNCQLTVVRVLPAEVWTGIKKHRWMSRVMRNDSSGSWGSQAQTPSWELDFPGHPFLTLHITTLHADREMSRDFILSVHKQVPSLFLSTEKWFLINWEHGITLNDENVLNVLCNSG